MVGIALWISAGCFQPKVESGRLRCAGGETGLCPSGFTCVAGLCEAPGARGDGGSTDSTGPAPDAPECRRVPPLAGCAEESASSLACDPVCQTGCGCNTKCSSSTEGAIGCFPVDLTTATMPPLAACTVSDMGTTNQSDNCAPGGICLDPVSGGSSLGTYCFSLCRTAADCPAGLACNPRRVGLGGSPASAMVCDLPFSVCDPMMVNDGTSPGCSKDRSQCYLLSPDASGGSQTACEYVGGSKGRDLDCSLPRDCIQGLTCPTADLIHRCRPICEPAVAGGCTAPATCRPYGGRYGYCL